MILTQLKSTAMKTKDSLSYAALIISVIISITSLAIVSPRNKNLDFDYIGVIIGLLSLIVTLLIGWQIYSTINIKNMISKEVHENLKSFEKNSLQAIVNSQYVIIMREYRINKASGNYNKMVFNMSTALYFASLIGNVDKMEFCINILNEIVENIDGDVVVEKKYWEDACDSLYKCTSICPEAIELLKKINKTI